jgi:hypothetical protein
MSLNWSVERVSGMDEVCFEIADYDAPMRGIAKGDRVLKPVTEALIWATLTVGMGSISQANHEQFFGRLEIVQKTKGPRLFLGGPDHKPYFITLADVRAHIGLSTNVSAVAGPSWLKDQIGLIVLEALREERLAKQKEEAA